MDKRKKKRKKNRLHTAAYILTVLIALTVGFLAFRYGRYHSGNALLSQARREAQQGQYRKAADTIDRIIDLRDSRVNVSARELQLMKADYQYHAGDYADAASSAVQLVSETASDSNLSEQAAEIAVNSYKKTADYAGIADFLHTFKDRPFVSDYAAYQSEAPEISLKSGSYAENINVTINSAGSGTVYYTTDGSDPSDESRQYLKALSLKEGNYTVRAVYINSYGVASQVTEREYTVTSRKPDPPSVSPRSGIYTSRTAITAQAEDDSCEIRYTDDGTEPDADSTLYEGPISMKTGSTTYSFVAVTKDGTVSDEVTRTYNYKPSGIPDTADGSDLIRDALSEQAVEKVKEELAGGKTIAQITGRSSQGASDSDTEEKAKGKSEKAEDSDTKPATPTQEEILQASYYYYNPASYYYSYLREVSLDSGIYYLYEEYYVGGSGISMKSENLYAVDLSTSDVFSASAAGSSYVLTKLSESDRFR